jgi:hypothetical protein
MRTSIKTSSSDNLPLIGLDDKELCKMYHTDSHYYGSEFQTHGSWLAKLRCTRLTKKTRKVGYQADMTDLLKKVDMLKNDGADAR